MKNYKKAFIQLVTFITIFNLSGCGKCDKETPHVHLYKSSVGIYKYGSDDFEYRSFDYEKTDIIKDVTIYERNYYDYLNKNDFINIEYNKELLYSYFPKLPDITIYEYKYDEEIVKKLKDEYGNIVEEKKKVTTKFGFSPLPEGKDLTGDSRVMSYAYRGYKIYYDEQTKRYNYELSGYYDSIDALINAGYTHIKFKTFGNSVDKREIIDTLVLKNKN